MPRKYGWTLPWLILFYGNNYYVPEEQDYYEDTPGGTVTCLVTFHEDALVAYIHPDEVPKIGKGPRFTNYNIVKLIIEPAYPNMKSVGKLQRDNLIDYISTFNKRLAKYLKEDS